MSTVAFVRGLGQRVCLFYSPSRCLFVINHTVIIVLLTPVASYKLLSLQPSATADSTRHMEQARGCVAVGAAVFRPSVSH